MEISDVRVRLVRDTGDRLKAVCTVTLDGEFVVRDVKVVEGTNGLFVAMPSRKLTLPCPRCRTQNHLRAKHCNECGAKLPPARIPADDDGREKAHRDVAHPITTAFRQRIQDRVLEAYRTEYDAGGTVAPHEDHEEAEPVFEPEPVMEAEGQEQPEEQPSMFDVEDTGVSDYDSLIADLKGGGGPRPMDRGPQRPPRSDHGRRSGPPPGRDRGRQPSHGQGGGNRREGGREGSRDHGRPQGRGGPPRDRGGPRRDDRPHRDRPSKWEVPQPAREPVEQPESDFGASLERGEAAPPPSRPTPPPSRPAPPPPAPKPVEPRKPAQPEPEEDAFGAGLI